MNFFMLIKKNKHVVYSHNNSCLCLMYLNIVQKKFSIPQLILLFSEKKDKEKPKLSSKKKDCFLVKIALFVICFIAIVIGFGILGKVNKKNFAVTLVVHVKAILILVYT